MILVFLTTRTILAFQAIVSYMLFGELVFAIWNVLLFGELNDVIHRIYFLVRRTYRNLLYIRRNIINKISHSLGPH